MALRGEEGDRAAHAEFLIVGMGADDDDVWHEGSVRCGDARWRGYSCEPTTISPMSLSPCSTCSRTSFSGLSTAQKPPARMWLP